jgi:Kazal-type serine protease inhibitor domain
MGTSADIKREEQMTTAFFRQAMTILALAFGLAFLVPTHAAAVGAGKTCGGIAGVACDYGLFCDFKAGSCRISDAQGKCVKVPTACPRIFRPVCGCDKKTYGNNCERLAAKAQLDHNGKCK